MGNDLLFWKVELLMFRDPRWQALDPPRKRLYGFESDEAECARMNETAKSLGLDYLFFPVGLWSSSTQLPSTKTRRLAAFVLSAKHRADGPMEVRECQGQIFRKRHILSAWKNNIGMEDDERRRMDS